MFIEDMKKIPTFGVAGNFTGHLEQAGEAADFAKVKTAEATAPKAIFPTYIPEADDDVTAKAANGSTTEGRAKSASVIAPGAASSAASASDATATTPTFLHTFPFDAEKIIFPKGEEKIQIEPECAVVFKALWQDGLLAGLSPICFGASNDCSIRKPGAPKISFKKNWGPSSKGFSKNLIELADFSEKSILADYRIASFLIRPSTGSGNGADTETGADNSECRTAGSACSVGGCSGNTLEIYDYGEDSAVKDYSYIWKKLTDWMIDRFNNHKNEGPAEEIGSYLKAAGRPEKIMVSIGATRYTEFGEKNFLKIGDRTAVILYPQSKYSHEEIKKMVLKNQTSKEEFFSDISALVQEVLLG